MIDDKTIEHIRTFDVVNFFRTRYGLDFIQRGSSYRAKQHPSLAIKADRLSWYWHSKNVGGFGVLDCLIRLENMTFGEAVATVTNVELLSAPIIQCMKEDAPPILELPENAGVTHRLYDYLCVRRGIDAQIVDVLVKDGTIYEDKRHNVVFIGRDEIGISRFACLRGTMLNVSFRSDVAGSNKRYGFRIDGKMTHLLYVFESAIDALSHATLTNIHRSNQNSWLHHTRLSLSGTSDVALSHYLHKSPSIREIILCLDNDEAGQNATRIIADKYTKKGYTIRKEIPENQDFNADLMALKQQTRRNEFERENRTCR